MVTVFGTSLSTGRVDLTSYAKRTDLNAIARVQANLQQKLPAIEQKVDTLQKSEGPRGEQGSKGESEETRVIRERMAIKVRTEKKVIRETKEKLVQEGKAPLVDCSRVSIPLRTICTAVLGLT